MDLRSHLTAAQVESGAKVLDYQPFILSDDLQTGVAYSWIRGGDPRDKPPLVFRRDEWLDEWEKISTANAALRHMYDDFIEEIARRYPGGSLLDIACNNGYFPVRAELAGMRHCAGVELGRHHRYAMRFLNDALGTSATFVHGRYDWKRRSIIPLWRSWLSRPILGRFDVVVASAIMCHLPDPLEFLAALGCVAQEAIFFWGQIVESRDMLIAFNPPHPTLGEAHPFPYGFNDNTRLSRGLFDFSMRQMGFREIIEIAPRASWLPFPDHVALLARR